MAAVAVCVLVVGVTATRIWWTARTDDRRPSDAVVVLGASQYDGRPSEVFTARLEHAAALYRAKVAPRVITVGGSAPGDRFTEAAAGRRWLVAHGVPASAVVAVPTGRNTLQSLRAVAVRMDASGWRTAVLVTDPWHSLRSRTIARDSGIDAITSPTRTGPAVRQRSTQLRYIGRETAAYLIYVTTHRSWERGPSAL